MKALYAKITESRLIMLPNAIDVPLADTFILVTKNGLVILIDTGMTGSAVTIEEEVSKLGGRVDACFITHQHDDHADGLVALLERGKISIGSLYWAPIDTEFIRLYEPESFEKAVVLDNALKSSSMEVHNLKAGDTFKLDNCEFEILAGGDEYTNNAVNNASLVFTVFDGKRKLLFTGDAGEEEGQELMKESVDVECDIVKVAHHGQNGLPLEFYNLTRAKTALFPTLGWLWEWPTTQATVKHLRDLGMEIYSVHCHGRVEL